jgi:hypothetical protein
MPSCVWAGRGYFDLATSSLLLFRNVTICFALSKRPDLLTEYLNSSLRPPKPCSAGRSHLFGLVLFLVPHIDVTESVDKANGQMI